ncbi:hypothetical protein [Paralimibaculum aggregatum]|nr:hypothetical protein [Limibaculum sp. NKW23]
MQWHSLAYPFLPASTRADFASFFDRDIEPLHGGGGPAPTVAQA